MSEFSTLERLKVRYDEIAPTKAVAPLKSSGGYIHSGGFTEA
jgi:hypothetical protein